MKNEIKNIAAYNLDDYLSRYSEGLIIIDVRSEKEYKEGHIRDAINIPYESFGIGKIQVSKNKRILVYCSRGGRSMRVAKVLYFNGYDVINVVGGMKEYIGRNIIK